MTDEKKQGTCPECQAEVKIEADAQVAEVVTCQDCNADLELISLKPIKLAPAPEVGEDWGE